MIGAKNFIGSLIDPWLQWGIRIFFLHCKNGRALVLPVDMTQGREKKNYKHLCLAFVIVFWLNTLHWLA